MPDEISESDKNKSLEELKPFGEPTESKHTTKISIRNPRENDNSAKA
jgi:hypothetical protein